MVKYRKHNQEIPEGYQIFERRLEVSGVQYRKRDATKFAKARTSWLELEPEPNNKYDPNALKVIGHWRDLFGNKRRQIGYVPRETAAKIADSGFTYRIKPRLMETSVRPNGFVLILFQILGPKGEKPEYQSS